MTNSAASFPVATQACEWSSEAGGVAWPISRPLWRKGEPGWDEMAHASNENIRRAPCRRSRNNADRVPAPLKKLIEPRPPLHTEEAPGRISRSRADAGQVQRFNGSRRAFPARVSGRDRGRHSRSGDNRASTGIRRSPDPPSDWKADRQVYGAPSMSSSSTTPNSRSPRSILSVPSVCSKPAASPPSAARRDGGDEASSRSGS